jgi:peroxiredoxin
MKKILVWAVFSLVIGFALSAPARAVEIGAVPPDIQLKDLDGQDFKLSDHKGELLILKLATTWCPTCVQQSGEFRQAAGYLKEKNIRVVEVFLQDSEKMVRQFLGQEKFEFPFTAMLDDGQALKAYNVYLIPRVILIDRDFKVLRDGNILTAGQIKAEFEKTRTEPR